MRQLLTPEEKPYVIPAIIQGSVFAAGFLVVSTLASSLFLHIWPSSDQDDVRVDLILPVYGSAYIISCLLSYLTGKLVLRKRLTANTHLKFALWAPFFFVVTYVLIAALFLLELAVGFQNALIDEAIMYCAFFTAMSVGYFYILVREREH